MEFANKRQLNTFVIYEHACNLLFSTNDIYLLVYVYSYCVLRHIFFVHSCGFNTNGINNIHIKNVQLSTRNTTNVT